MPFIARRPDDAPERPDFEHDEPFMAEAQRKLEAIKKGLDEEFKLLRSSEGESIYGEVIDFLTDAIATLRNAEPE